MKNLEFILKLTVLKKKQKVKTTPFSTYYINHLSTLSETDLDKYDKEFKTNRWKPARKFVKSSNLVK